MNKRASRIRVIGFLLGIDCLFAPGCGQKQDHEAGAVEFLIEAMPTNLDPRIGTDAYSQHLDGLIFSSLVWHDDNMNCRGG